MTQTASALLLAWETAVSTQSENRGRGCWAGRAGSLGRSFDGSKARRALAQLGAPRKGAVFNVCVDPLLTSFHKPQARGVDVLWATFHEFHLSPPRWLRGSASVC